MSIGLIIFPGPFLSSHLTLASHVSLERDHSCSSYPLEEVEYEDSPSRYLQDLDSDGTSFLVP